MQEEKTERFAVDAEGDNPDPVGVLPADNALSARFRGVSMGSVFALYQEIPTPNSSYSIDESPTLGH
jgi:hypothetical protein